MSWRLAIVGWALLLFMVAVLVPVHVDDAAEEGSRVVVFGLRGDQTATFRLTGEERVVRILAWLEAPAPDVLDESRTWTYAVDLELDPNDRAPMTWTHHTRSRLSLRDDESLSIVAPGADRIVTDSRIIDLQPQHLLERAGTLTIAPAELGPDERLFIRVLREIQAENIDPTGQRLKQIRSRLRRVYPRPWPELTRDERQWYEGTRRRALPADSLEGTTVPILIRAPPSRVPTAPDHGFRLAPGAATAVNVRGPATLTAEVRLEEGGLPGTLKTAALRTEVVDGSMEPLLVPDGGTRETFVVPDGAIWSVRFYNEWDSPPVFVRFSLDPDQGQSWGEPPGAGAEQPLEPERRRITVFRAGPGLSPIVAPVIAGADWDALRIEARPLADEVWKLHPEDDPEQTPVTITWVSRDSEGQELSRGEFPVKWLYSPFEQFVENDEEPMSDGTSRFLHYPVAAATVEFTADAPIDIRFLAPLDITPVRAPEYEVGPLTLGRYAPWELAQYVGVAPENLEELVTQDRLTRFDATVRIETLESQVDPTTGQGRPKSSLTTRTVEPIGRHPRHPLVEPVRSPSGWKDWYRVQLGATTRLEIGPDGRVPIDWRIRSSDVGSTFRLRCGEVESSAELIASTGHIDLFGLPSGSQDCSMEGPAGTYLAQLQGRGRWWAGRTTWRPAGTHTIAARRALEEERLFIRTYTPVGSPPPTITVRIDGGELVRFPTTTAVRTTPERIFVPQEITGQARLVNGSAVTAWQAMGVKLRDDLAPGAHTVQVDIRSADGRPVYVRYDASWGRDPAFSGRHWTEVNE